MMIQFNRVLKFLKKHTKKPYFYIIFALLLFAMFIITFSVSSQNMHRMALLHLNTKTLNLIQPISDEIKDPIDTWQIIGDPIKRQKIFSAYFDPRMEPLLRIDTGNLPFGTIRVFAVLELKRTESVYCLYRYTNITGRVVKAYEVLPVHEHFDMKFSAFIIACPLSEAHNVKQIHLPISVAIAYHSDKRSFSKPTFITVKYSNGNLYKDPEIKLAACVGPLQQNYNEALRIVEFVEIYKLLGVKKFYFYNLSASLNVNKVIQYYKNANIAEIINWNFYGYKFEDEVRYGGILVAINDCMYRSTFIDNFKYVAIIDFDEILIPFKHATLLDYANEKLLDNNYINALIFRGTFFYKNFKSDYTHKPSNIKIKFLYTQTKIERTLNPLKPHSRSKYIANARSIIETGSHQIWRSLPNYGEYYVPINEGLLYHYRTDCIVNENTCNGPKTIDFSARRFGSLLWYNVDLACKIIFTNDTCPKSDWIESPNYLLA